MHLQEMHYHLHTGVCTLHVSSLQLNCLKKKSLNRDTQSGKQRLFFSWQLLPFKIPGWFIQPLYCYYLDHD